MAKHIKMTKKSLGIVLILLALVGLVAFLRWGSHSNTPARQPSSNADSSINMSPPTPEEIEQAKSDKQDVINKDLQSSTTQQNTFKSVTPIVTDARQYGNNVEVSAYISGVFEEGGKCNATFKNGLGSFTRTTTGVSNANSVNCPVFSVSSSSFVPKGTWSVTVSYSSATSSGVSDAKQFEVK